MFITLGAHTETIACPTRHQASCSSIDYTWDNALQMLFLDDQKQIERHRLNVCLATWGQFALSEAEQLGNPEETVCRAVCIKNWLFFQWS